MIKINRHHFVQLLLLATALPFGLLAAGAMSAHAGTVTVTGANGRNTGLGTAGAGGPATAATTTPSDPSNIAAATGGNGGSHCYGSVASGCFPGGSGGAGGAANATATTSIRSGAASAQATALGGAGGEGGPGGEGGLPGPGGLGGAASSSASASSAAGPASATANSTGGHGGIGRGLGIGGPFDAGGAATAAASATVSHATGAASAAATSTGGGASAGVSPSGAAAASANAQNIAGAAFTGASAPAGSSASAVTNATVNNATLVSQPGAPVPIDAGRVVSNAILIPHGLTQSDSAIGVGAMSAGYGESAVLAARSNLALTYEATATFDFNTSIESLDLDLLSFIDKSAGTPFDSLELQVLVQGETPRTYKFSGLAGSGGAAKFFTADPIGLGAIAADHSIEIEYFLGYKSGTSAMPGDGFSFAYKLVDPPPGATVPEPSTWAMMLVGFASLAFAGYRARRGAAVVKKT
jgi:hypothetical protein